MPETYYQQPARKERDDVGDHKRYQQYLDSLPPELRAKILAERSNEEASKKLEGFDKAIAAACDAAMSVAVVAYAEAKNDREREDAVRCTSVTITTLQQVKSVLQHVLPPGPKSQILGMVVNGCAAGIEQYDQIVRQLLPLGMARRARILEIGYAAFDEEERQAEIERRRQNELVQEVADHGLEGAAERARQALGIPAEPIGQTEGGGVVSTEGGTLE